MHRSGTSVLARILNTAGANMGYEVDRNHEALFFQGINKYILSLENDFWYSFEKTEKRLTDQTVVTTIAGEIEQQVKELILKDFFKVKNEWESFFFRMFDRHLWGWKDPRNTITLPIWKKIFPKAKVLIIYRNPYDTVISLFNRELPRKSYRQFNTAEFNFNVWRSYTRKCMEIEQQYGQHCIAVKYEELFKSDTLKSLEKFTGLDLNNGKIKGLEKHSGNHPSWREKATLIELIASCDLVRKLNYEGFGYKG